MAVDRAFHPLPRKWTAHSTRSRGRGSTGSTRCGGPAPRTRPNVRRGDAVAPQRRGLGKGLGALIPEAPRPGGAATSGSQISPGTQAGDGSAVSLQPSGTPVSSPGTFTSPPGDAGLAASPAEAALRQVAGAYFEEIEVGMISANPRQPRRTF